MRNVIEEVLTCLNCLVLTSTGPNPTLLDPGNLPGLKTHFHIELINLKRPLSSHRELFE